MSDEDRKVISFSKYQGKKPNSAKTFFNPKRPLYRKFKLYFGYYVNGNITSYWILFVSAEGFMRPPTRFQLWLLNLIIPCKLEWLD